MTKSINIMSNNKSTELEVSSPALPIQKIAIRNIDTSSKLSISGKTTYQEIEIANTECTGAVKIGPVCPYKKAIDVALNQAIPKSLSLFTQVSAQELSDSNIRSAGKIYVDLDGKESIVTLEDIKQMNTKTLLVDSISDNQIDKLSEYDFILVNENSK